MLDKMAQNLDFKNMEEAARYRQRKGLFKVVELNGKLQQFAAACRIVRNHSHITAKELSEALPHKDHAFDDSSICLFERSEGNYAKGKMSLAPRTLCNLLAGLYLAEQEKPTALLQESHELRVIAGAMQMDDAFTLSHRMKLRVEAAMDDVIAAAAAKNDTFRDMVTKSLIIGNI